MNVYFRVLIQKQNIRNKVMKKLKRVNNQIKKKKKKNQRKKSKALIQRIFLTFKNPIQDHLITMTL